MLSSAPAKEAEAPEEAADDALADADADAEAEADADADAEAEADALPDEAQPANMLPPTRAAPANPARRKASRLEYTRPYSDSMIFPSLPGSALLTIIFFGTFILIFQYSLLNIFLF